MLFVTSDLNCLSGFSLVHVTVCAGNYNGFGDYNGDSWDGGRGYGGRGRGRERGGSFRGRGRGYGQLGGYYDYVEGAPAQGRGMFFYYLYHYIQFISFKAF